MPDLRTILRGIRGRVRRHYEYFSGIDEMRTRYGLVDPVLWGLGWRTHDPDRVKVEFDLPDGGKVDYALLKSGCPIAIVEAKKLGPDKAEPFALASDADNAQLSRAWDSLQSPIAPSPASSTIREMHNANWRQSRFIRAHQDQLESYVDTLGMDTGYAVLTDGDEWHIFNLARRSGSLSQSPAISTSILFSLGMGEVVAALDTISR